jgi:hypothetical protein
VKNVLELAVKNELSLALNSRRPPRAGRPAWCGDWRGFQLASPGGQRYSVIVQLTDKAQLVADLVRGHAVPLGRSQVSLGRVDCFAAIADQINGAVREDELPIDCTTVSARARQAMLVLVPLRLANAARDRGEVAWNRELVEASLIGLLSRTDHANTLVRELFLQLLALELAAPQSRAFARGEYERMGLQLARLRQDDQSLPYNPVLAYDRHTKGITDTNSKLSQEERKRYAWFLEQATLEQIVEVMGLF